MNSIHQLTSDVKDRILTSLTIAMERGTTDWPLPPPPIQDPDFPLRPPKNPSSLIEKGRALFEIDRAGLERHVRSTVEHMIPHRIGVLDDRIEDHFHHVFRRFDDFSERIMFALFSEWMWQALDPEAPDSDRWYLALSLVTGLCNRPTGAPIHQGYHLLESIAVALPPGRWHGELSKGPHQLEWDPKSSPPKAELEVNMSGRTAAQWLLNRLENGGIEGQLLLIEWIRLLLERPTIASALGVPNRIDRLSHSTSEVASKITITLPRLIELDKDIAIRVIFYLSSRSEVDVRRSLADIQTRLFRRLGDEVLPIFDLQLCDDDHDVLAAASATIRDLKYFDVDGFADRLSTLVDHSHIPVQRNAAIAMRDYLEHFPNDERGILLRSWMQNDEVVRVRLRELLLRLQEIQPEVFSQIAQKILELDEHGLESIFSVLSIRNKSRARAWEDHLRSQGEIPLSILDSDFSEE